MGTRVSASLSRRARPRRTRSSIATDRLDHPRQLRVRSPRHGLWPVHWAFRPLLAKWATASTTSARTSSPTRPMSPGLASPPARRGSFFSLSNAGYAWANSFSPDRRGFNEPPLLAYRPRLAADFRRPCHLRARRIGDPATAPTSAPAAALPATFLWRPALAGASGAAPLADVGRGSAVRRAAQRQRPERRLLRRLRRLRRLRPRFLATLRRTRSAGASTRASKSTFPGRASSW